MSTSEITVEHMNNKLHLRQVCPFCGETNTLVLPSTEEMIQGIRKWTTGVCIQNALPILSPDQREFFLTGNCKCIWGN